MTGIEQTITTHPALVIVIISLLFATLCWFIRQTIHRLIGVLEKLEKSITIFDNRLDKLETRIASQETRCSTIREITQQCNGLNTPSPD